MKMTPEFKVGLFTAAALITFMFSILFVSNFRFTSGGYVVVATFDFLGDLKVNAPVEYAGGIRVGEVRNIRYANNKALVDLLITDKNFKLRQDSLVALYSTGLLGSRYVEIGADLGEGPELKSGETIVGKNANNLDKTFSQLGDVMENFEAMMGDPKSKANFLKSFENMSKATDSLLALSISSREKVEKILADLSKSSGNVGQLVQSATKVSQSLEGLTSALNKKDIALTMKNLNETMITMHQLTSDIHNGKGVVGVLLQDEKTANDLRALVEELKSHPWKLLWKK